MSKMKNCFILGEVRAIADLVPYLDGMLLTRINVPEKSRQKGYGSRLLRNILNEADRTQTKLYLAPSSSGWMTNPQLSRWYNRHGFVWAGEIMLRNPRKDYVGTDTSDDPDARGCDPVSSYKEYEQEALPPRGGEGGEDS